MRAKEDNEVSTLNDLCKLVLDQKIGEMDSYELVISDWSISGRKGKRRMGFRLTTVVTIGGVRYELASANEICFEHGELTLALPKSALTLTGA